MASGEAATTMGRTVLGGWKGVNGDDLVASIIPKWLWIRNVAATDTDKTDDSEVVDGVF
jgi:hypothetical protein